MVTILFAAIILLLLIGTPIAFAIGTGSLAALLWGGNHPVNCNNAENVCRSGFLAPHGYPFIHACRTIDDLGRDVEAAH